MDLNLIAVLLYFICHIISILACLRFLCAFRTFTKKTLALSMISVLSASDLFFHCFAILLVALPDDVVSPVRQLIMNFSLRFMAFCSASIGIVIFRSLTNTTVEDSERFYRLNLVLLIVISSAFTLLWELVTMKPTSKEFYLAAVPMFLCLGITIFFFVRSILAIRILPEGIQRGMKSTVISLFYYPFVQLLLLLPVIGFTYFMSIHVIEMETSLGIILTLPMALVGFGNTMIFLIQQKGNQNLTESTEKLGEINATLSSMEHTEQSTFYHHA